MATLKVYRTGTNRHTSFCVLYTVTQPFPVSKDVLIHFVEYLYMEELKAGTIKSYLVSVHHAQIALGLGNPQIEEMSRLKCVTHGVKSLTSGPTCSRLPITLSLLTQLHHSWCIERSDRNATMLWAAVTMCFFGFLRVGEIVAPPGSGFDPSIHLSVGDVSVYSHSIPSYLAVSIKASKTDPFRQGVTIYLGRTHDWICPVATMLNYLVVRGTSKGPLFIFRDGTHLTHDNFVSAVHKALSTAGVDTSKYAGHNFRIGATTMAAKLSIQDSLIRTMDRWESSAYLLYIHTLREKICSVADTTQGPASWGLTSNSTQQRWGLTPLELTVTDCAPYQVRLVK